jgi:hypothetical protein
MRRVAVHATPTASPTDEVEAEREWLRPSERASESIALPPAEGRLCHAA